MAKRRALAAALRFADRAGELVAGSQAEALHEALADVNVPFRGSVADFPTADEARAFAGQLEHAERFVVRHTDVWRYRVKKTYAKNESCGGRRT